MNNYFTSNQEELFNSINLCKKLISELTLTSAPCPVLQDQFIELKVFPKSLLKFVSKFVSKLEETIK